MTQETSEIDTIDTTGEKLDEIGNEYRYKCTRCNKFKTSRSFHKKCDTANGLKSICKICIQKQSKQYRIENTDAITRERKLVKDRMSQLGDAYIMNSVRSAIHRARQKGYSNYDSKEKLFKYLKEMGGVPKRCPILGIKLEYGGGSTANSPSLDRIDVSKGYVVGNVWYISARANLMKNDASFPELQKFSKYFLKNFTSWGKKRKD